MFAVLRRRSFDVLAGLTLVMCVGCGSSTGTSEPAATNTRADTPPTAAIPGQKAAVDDDEDPDDLPDISIEEPKEGTPEWFVREAMRLKLEPLPKTDDVEQLRKHRRERNEKIISHCEQAIAATHENEKQARLFTAAVRNLLDARLQLALQGSAEDIDALYTDARVLIDRDINSEAATEASFTLVNLAYNLARRTAEGDVEWIREFSRQATFFAVTYPKEEVRSVPLLFTAARSCELNGLQEEAVGCYSLIVKSFPRNQYSSSATTILRRLRLPGNSVQIAGPTLNGGNFALDDLLGRPVLVVFWSTEAKPFEDQLPKVLEAIGKHSKAGLQVVGINLDTETAAVKQFVSKHKIGWPQVVFDDPSQRGWNHPVANFYGVMEIPAYWLVDASGAVVSTSLTADGLDAAITALTGAPAARSATRTGDGVPARQ